MPPGADGASALTRARRRGCSPACDIGPAQTSQLRRNPPDRSARLAGQPGSVKTAAVELQQDGGRTEGPAAVGQQNTRSGMKIPPTKGGGRGGEHRECMQRAGRAECQKTIAESIHSVQSLPVSICLYKLLVPGVLFRSSLHLFLVPCCLTLELGVLST